MEQELEHEQRGDLGEHVHGALSLRGSQTQLLTRHTTTLTWGPATTENESIENFQRFPINFQ